MEFFKNGKSIILEKIESESYDMYYDRGKFIINQNDKISLDDLELYSKIYTYIKYKNCVYNKDINNLIKNMSENI